MKEYKINPELEKCLPPLSDMEFEKLKTSIQTQGYDEAKPIVLWKEYPDTIVDGHHRYKICRELGIEPSYVVKSFESLDKAILYTLHRQTEQRNLSAAQLVEIAEQMIPLEEKIKLEEEAREAQISNLKQGDKIPVSAPESPTGESKKVAVKIAEKAGVSPRTVYRVHNVKEKGASEVKELMSKGELSAKAADDFVRIVPSKEEQTKIVENGGVEAIKQTVSQKVEHALELLSEKPAWEEESTEEGKHNQEMFWNYNNWLVIRGMLDKLFCPNCGCVDLKLQCCGMSIEDAAKIAHDKTQAAIDETNAKRKVIADE
jgi:ParB-like chromosome segregation protein Spo0J